MSQRPRCHSASNAKYYSYAKQQYPLLWHFLNKIALGSINVLGAIYLRPGKMSGEDPCFASFICIYAALDFVMDIVDGRVSLVVPCYEVEAWFGCFLQSVLMQDWNDLEIILVNDGSGSVTSSLLRASIPLFAERGWRSKLIDQQNKGLGGAVDAGLKYVTGEFLMWPDPDDWLLPGSIAHRVQLLRENPDVGLLRSNCHLYIEDTKAFDGFFWPTNLPPFRATQLFEDFVYQRHFYAPVCHFVRCSMFWQMHPDRMIWFSKASSQNYQLLVPFVERFPVLQVPDVLACYRVRGDSRSRAPTKTPEKLMARHEQLYELTLHTIPKLLTYTPVRAERLKNHHWRSKMLPTAIRAKMKSKGLALIAQANLSAWRKAVARACLQLRCNAGFDAIDQRTGRIVSRLLARTLDAVVRMPEREAVWGAASLWPELEQVSSEAAS